MSRDPKGQTQTRDPNTLRAQYLENRCYLPTIAVLSAILATA